jgi:hypothetical protein
VATVHDVVKIPGWVLPHPSAVLHTCSSVDTPWVARDYPVFHLHMIYLNMDLDRLTCIQILEVPLHVEKGT